MSVAPLPSAPLSRLISLPSVADTSASGPSTSVPTPAPGMIWTPAPPSSPLTEGSGNTAPAPWASSVPSKLVVSANRIVAEPAVPVVLATVIDTPAPRASFARPSDPPGTVLNPIGRTVPSPIDRVA